MIEIHSDLNALTTKSVLKFAEPTPFHGYKDILNSINKMQTELLPAGGVFEATKIPYTRSLYGDILQNPTSLSINDSQKMAYADSTVHSSLKYISIMVTSRIKSYKHKNKDMQHIVNYSLDNLRIGKLKFYDALMTALWAGFSSNYLVWHTYKGKYIVKDVIPMPPSSVIMSVDQNGSLKGFGGIMQYYYNTNINGYANPFTYGGAIGNGDPNIPRGDFPIPLRVPYINPMYLKPFHEKDILLYSISGNDGATNPYGRMVTRAAWQPYTYKNGLLQNMMIAATYKSAPLLVFYTDSTRPVQDSLGNVFSIADNIREQLNTYNGNGFLVIEGKKGEVVEHATVDNTANLEDFIKCINEQDNQIRTSFLLPDTALQAEGSFATASAHSSMLGKYIDYMTASVCEVILHQFVKKIINYNWYEEDLGYFEISEQSLDDKLKMAKVLEFGYNYNVLCHDQNNPEQSLYDLNMARNMMEWGTADELFINPELEAQMGTNFGDTNRQAGTPYADGVKNYLKRYDK